MPATDERPHPVELLLCGHHYRISQQALDRMGAQVFEIDGTPEAFLRPQPESPQQAVT